MTWWITTTSQKASDRVRTDRAQYARDYGFPDKFFLSVCRLVEKKNIDGVITAYQLYREINGDASWPLIIVGDGPLGPRLRQFTTIRRLDDKISFAGEIGYRELPIYYGLASALVHASKVEQWGLVVNEAMASGLPVLVSRRCGCSYELLEEGANGVSFDPDDTAGLARAMQLLGDDRLRTCMAQRSREIISKWSPDAFATGLALATETALHGPRREVGLSDIAMLGALARRPRTGGE